MQLRDIDARICEAVRAHPKKRGITSAELALDLGVSRDYLRARIRMMEREGALPAAVSKKLAPQRAAVPDKDLDAAWRTCASVTDVAERVGLSRAGVLQRIQQLRARGSKLRPRPHLAKTRAKRDAELAARIRGRKRKPAVDAAPAAPVLSLAAAPTTSTTPAASSEEVGRESA